MTIAIVFCLVLMIVLLAIRQSSRERQERLQAFRLRFGKISTRKYAAGQLAHIGSCARNFKKDHPQTFYVDDQTWSDLEMDRIFGALDSGMSPVGREYLYTSLRLPLEASHQAHSLNKFAELFMRNVSEREKTWQCFEELKPSRGTGTDKKDVLSLYEYLDTLTGLTGISCAPSIAACLAFFASIAFFFFSPTIGVLMTAAVIAVNLASYFHIRGRLGNYFRSLQKASSLARFAARYSRLMPERKDAVSLQIAELSRELAPLRRNVWLLELGGGSSLPDVLMSYVRMLTHCDLIYFSVSAARAKAYRNDLMELYRDAGFLETALAAASFRQALPVWSRPTILSERRLKLEEVYHPLIKAAVSNSVDLSQNLLLTGSNASGKSTFLRTAALAVILGEALDTVPAEGAEFAPFAIMSAMTAADSLESGASLYMAEIQSLKRITNAAAAGKYPILACADEILRGTNTAERIAGSTEILRWLGRQKCLVLAATHDGELTGALAGEGAENYVNMHFSEDTDDSGVVFSYKMKPGPAGSSNAIALLRRVGFPEETTERAAKDAALLLAQSPYGV